MTTDEQERQRIKAMFMRTASEQFDNGWGQGYTEGVKDGKAIGFVAGVQSVQDALSDGLRHGSSVCGSALNSLKDLGIDRDEDEDE